MREQATGVWTVLPGALLVVASVCTVSLDSAADVQRAQNPGPPSAPAANEIKVLPVQGNIHMLVGAGANLTASVGDDGVLLVDTGSAESSPQVLAALRNLSAKPLNYIINTSFLEPHTGGNEVVAKAGRVLTDPVSTQAIVLGHETLLNRMSAPTGHVAPRPVGAWPTDTFFTARKDMHFNGEAVQIFHRPARTDSDSFVFFRKSDVISAGDIYSTTSYPVIDLKAGGHVNGVIEGLNDILDLAVPVNVVEGGTLVIPSSGRLSDELDVAVYRDMVTIIRDRVQDAVKRGMTRAQITSDRRLTLEYAGRYGATTGPWTTEMFLDAIYTNLTAKE
jgi:glyoxylase-like metal-dependent hydrolase (beta-lactamase superfamily II)